MNLTNETVLRLIRAALFCRDLPELWDEKTDWREVYAECQKQAILPLFVDILPDLPLDPSTREIWKKQILSHTLRQTTFVNLQSELDRLMREAGINYAVLKGFAAAQYYDQPLMRTTGDIDVLVRPEDVDRALALLRENGFTVEDDGRNLRHIGLTKAGIHVELHRYFCITEKEDAIDAKMNGMLTEGLNTSLQTIPIPGGDPSDSSTCSVFDDRLNGLILLYHIGQHLPSGLGYRQIIDFLLYSVRCLDDKGWNDGFQQIAAEAQLDTLAKAVLRMGQLYFGVPDSIGWCKDIGDDLPRELMAYISRQGNFGRKDGSTVAHVLNTSRGSLLSRLRFEQASGLYHWEAARKHAVLRPFAWIYGIAHHARMMTKRGLWKRLRQDIAASGKQSDLLNRLHVRKRY